jgi:3-oxoacyl-[acyl-carrier protein] reductase
MKKVLVVGGSGGLGAQVVGLISSKYNITSVSSKDFDIRSISECENFFEGKTFDVIINFAGLNYDTFIHKISSENIENIQNLLDVNIKGTVNLVSTGLKNMRKHKYQANEKDDSPSKQPHSLDTCFYTLVLTIKLGTN